MTDLTLLKLLASDEWVADPATISAVAREAANEIERLRAQVERLTEVLRPFAACVFNDNGDITLSTGDLRLEHWWRVSKAVSSTVLPSTEGGE